MKTSNLADLPELYRPLSVDKVPLGGIHEVIVARPEEKQALAKRFNILEILKCEAELDVDHSKAKMFLVTGSMVAEIIQPCVLTLEPLKQKVKANIRVLFAPPQLLDKGAGSPHYEGGDEDMPEPIVKGVIDLGELVAQHLAINIDPYPRKPGAEIDLAKRFKADKADKADKAVPEEQKIGSVRVTGGKKTGEVKLTKSPELTAQKPNPFAKLTSLVNFKEKPQSQTNFKGKKPDQDKK